MPGGADPERQQRDDALNAWGDAIYVAALLCDCVYKIAESGSSDEFLSALRRTLAPSGSLPVHRLDGETLRVLPSRGDIPQRYVLAESSAAPSLVFCCFMGTKTIADVRVNVDVGLRGRKHTLLWQRALGVLPTIKTLHQYHCALGGRRLVLCGHSLGGMLAQLVVLLLGEEAEADVGLLTFGSPGVLGLVDHVLRDLGRSSSRLPRLNFVSRSDMVVRGARRVLGVGRPHRTDIDEYVGRLLEVESPLGWSAPRGLDGLHGHGMLGYRRLAERYRARASGQKGERGGGATTSNPLSVVRGDRGLVPQVSVRRVDVSAVRDPETASSPRVFAHGRWIGMGRWTGIDRQLQTATYEGDFTDGARRFPFRPLQGSKL